jgi:hypothetical protein
VSRPLARAAFRVIAAFVCWLGSIQLIAILNGLPSPLLSAKDFLLARLPGGTGAVLNSNFVTSIAGALAGAFFGAWGAQKIAARSKRRDDLLNEIRNTNAAIMLAFTVTDLSLSLKKQHVKPLKKIFEQQQLAYAIHLTQRTLGVARPVAIHFDLGTITPITLPMNILQHTVFEKISIGGRPLALMAILSQSAEILNASLKHRNELVTEFERRNVRNSAALLPEYLGLVQPPGKINQKYPDFVSAIFATTDDLIFFSLLMGKDLVAHGDKLAERFKREFEENPPAISRLMHWRQDVSSLIPDDSEYRSWLDGFVTQTATDGLVGAKQ